MYTYIHTYIYIYVLCIIYTCRSYSMHLHFILKFSDVNGRSPGSNTWRYVGTIFLVIFWGNSPWNLGLKNRPYLMVGTSTQLDPEIPIENIQHHPICLAIFCGDIPIDSHWRCSVWKRKGQVSPPRPAAGRSVRAASGTSPVRGPGFSIGGWRCKNIYGFIVVEISP